MSMPDTISVIIIDDEPLARNIILEYLNTNPRFKVVAECGDGFEGAKAIMEHKPELVFVDIQMPKITGFEMLELIDEKPGIIFTTAFDEYAVKAFEKHAIDYLLKPIPHLRFQQAIEKFLQGNMTTESQVAEFRKEDSGSWQRFVVRTGNKIKIIPVEEVISIAADDDYIQISTAEGIYLKKETLGNCEKHLEGHNFSRVHRSHIINILCIDRLEPYEKENYLAVLKNGHKIPVSKNGYSRLRQILGK